MEWEVSEAYGGAVVRRLAYGMQELSELAHIAVPMLRHECRHDAGRTFSVREKLLNEQWDVGDALSQWRNSDRYLAGRGQRPVGVIGQLERRPEHREDPVAHITVAGGPTARSSLRCCSESGAEYCGVKTSEFRPLRRLRCHDAAIAVLTDTAGCRSADDRNSSR
jgi:hypothetical protein